MKKVNFPLLIGTIIVLSLIHILEKTTKMGGNTILSGGALNAVDEGSETAIANNDSVELHYTQTFKGGDEQGDETLVHTLTDNGLSLIHI